MTSLATRIEGQTFVTGAASGIGASLGRKLAEAGVPVCLADIDRAGVQRLADDLVASGAEARAMELDVSRRGAFADAIAQAEQHGAPVDLLINNAGVGLAGEVRDYEDGDWERVMSVNLFGVIHGVDAVYSRMLRRRRGTIVNIASLAGLVAIPGEAPYVASKHAVVGLTRALSAEAQQLGVHVCLVCPGVVQTPIYDSSPVRGFDEKKVLELWPKGVTADACATTILRGVAAKKKTVVVGGSAKLLWWMERVSPGLMGNLRRAYMRRVRQFRVE